MRSHRGTTTKSLIGILILTFGGCAPNADSEIADLTDDDIGASAEELGGASEFCDAIHSREHFVDVGDGVQLHVLERFSGRALLRHPRRAVLMIPATLTNNDLYDAQVAGDPSYNALDTFAAEGWFAYSVSYEGYGQSTHPDDGATVTIERSLPQMNEVLEWIRRRRFVRDVDILGTSVGSDLAIALGGLQNGRDRHHVGHIVLTATVYLAFSELVQTVAFTPEFEAFLLSIPDGYVETFPPFYDLVISEVDPDARAWAYATLPGIYATGPTLEAFDLPATDATSGRAPALTFWGTNDPVTTRDDVYALQADYGGDMRVVEIAGGGHGPYIEPGRHVFWEETFGFLTEDEHHAINVCDYIH